MKSWARGMVYTLEHQSSLHHTTYTPGALTQAPDKPRLTRPLLIIYHLFWDGQPSDSDSTFSFCQQVNSSKTNFWGMKSVGGKLIFHNMQHINYFRVFFPYFLQKYTFKSANIYNSIIHLSRKLTPCSNMSSL